MKSAIFVFRECLWDSMEPHGVILRSPQPSKNEPKTHQKINPTCPLAFLEHENCRFHRMQKLYENQTFINRISYDSRNANKVPTLDLEAPK